MLRHVVVLPALRHLPRKGKIVAVELSNAARAVMAGSTDTGFIASSLYHSLC